LRSPYPDLWKCKQPVPESLNTLGDHIRQRRLELHVHQLELAAILGVHKGSIQNWERNIYQPATELVPKIVLWLGYDPKQKTPTILTRQ